MDSDIAQEKHNDPFQHKQNIKSWSWSWLW